MIRYGHAQGRVFVAPGVWVAGFGGVVVGVPAASVSGGAARPGPRGGRRPPSLLSALRRGRSCVGCLRRRGFRGPIT